DEAIEALWHEAERAHSTQVRHYHTLAHLEDLHAKLGPLRGQLLDPDAVTLAIVYHDIVYRVSRKDNEERSAELMRERLAPLGVPSPLIGRVQAHILATKA